MTYISWSSDFVLFLDDYLEFGIMSLNDPFDPKINIGHCDIYSPQSSDF